jgi:hypothetical protein
MGLSLGGSMGGSSSQSTANSAGTTANTYSPGQSALQTALLSAFSSIIPGMSTGALSPNVAAAATGSANAINQTGASTLQRVNQFLASRGMGGSGQSGQADLATSLNTASNLGANQSAAAGQQLGLTSGYLTDALGAAFNPSGQTTSNSGSTKGSGSSYGFGVGAGGSPAQFASAFA